MTHKFTIVLDNITQKFFSLKLISLIPKIQPLLSSSPSKNNSKKIPSLKLIFNYDGKVCQKGSKRIWKKNIQTIVMEIPLWLLFFVFDLVVSLDSGKIYFFYPQKNKSFSTIVKSSKRTMRIVCKEEIAIKLHQIGRNYCCWMVFIL